MPIFSSENVLLLAKQNFLDPALITHHYQQDGLYVWKPYLELVAKIVCNHGNDRDSGQCYGG